MNLSLYPAARFCRLLILLLAGLSGLGNVERSFGQTVAPEVLNRAKQATVFIRGPEGEGTGFLIERNTTAGIIATAAHVVADDDENKDNQVDVFFSSGTESEYEFTASVIGLDAAKDVAFLRVTAPNLPEPIYLAPGADITETMDVVIAGFPFGDQISIASRNPSLTISKGSISSIKQGAINSVAMLQLDVSVNPGNSGGPVLNSQGEAIGIISAKVQGTQLGFAIPAATVMRDYMGDCADVSGSFLLVNEDRTDCKLYGKLIDPLGRIEGVSLNFTSITSLPSLNLRANKAWPKLPSKTELKCDLQGREFSLELRLPLEGLALDETIVQVVCSRVDGTTAFSAPFSLKRLKEEYFDPQRHKDTSDDPMPHAPPKRDDDPDESKRADRPESSTPPLTAQLVKNVHLTRLEPISTTSFKKRGAVSELVEIDGVGIRRVLIPHRPYSPQVLWNAIGDKLVLVGRELTLIDYPAAQKVEVFQLSHEQASAEFIDGDLRVSFGNNVVGRIDLESMKSRLEWKFNRYIKSYSSQHHWLISPTGNQPPEVYACHELQGVLRQPIDLTNRKELAPPAEIFVPRHGNSLFTWGANHLNRFSLVEGGARFAGSVPTSFNDKVAPQFVASNDDQMVAMLVRRKVKDAYQSQIAFFADDLQQQYDVEVPDWITCMVNDKNRQRSIVGGAKGLWAWSTEDEKPYRLPFPASAPPVTAMSLHPDGQTLAVLCGGVLGSGALYWMDLDHSDEAANN